VLLAAACLAGAIASTVTYVSLVRLQRAVVASRQARGCDRILRDVHASDTPLNPSSLRAGIVAGCLIRMGKLKQADRTMAVAASREPGNVFVWLTYATYQVARRRPAAARTAYLHARSLDPHLPPPRS